MLFSSKIKAIQNQFLVNCVKSVKGYHHTIIYMKMKYIFLITMLLTTTFLYGQESPLTLEKIWASNELAFNRVPGFNFQLDGRHYTRLENGTIKQYDLETGLSTKDLLDMDQLRISNPDFEVGGYEFSDDETKMLIYNNRSPIYRRSFMANYYVYDTKAQSLTPILSQKIQSAHFSPDGSKVAYVKDNNLFYKDLSTDQIIQITSDGEFNSIINGQTDWVYEEEFSLVRAFEWSSDNKKLAFVRFDEREVSEFTMTKYHDNLYPSYYTFKYPKVGEKNSVVSTHIYNTESDIVIDVDLHEDKDSYIPRIQWTQDPDKLCVTWINRHQNHLKLYAVDAVTGQATVMMEEKNPYYVKIHDNLYFLKDGRRFLWLSEKDGFNHIYLYDISGKMVKQLTSGNYDVTNVYGYSDQKGMVYFQSAEKKSTQRSVRKGHVKSGKLYDLHSEDGWNQAQFSTNFDYVVVNHSDINTAPTYTVYDKNNSIVRVIESNAKYADIQKMNDAQHIELFSIPVADGINLNAWKIMPTNFNPDKKYPVLMFLYGGPNSQRVKDQYAISYHWWFQLMAQKGYMVVCVDNRGTGGRGQEFRKITYQQLGKYETIDQIDAAKYLGALDYVDADRIGIFGWSYGGYLSSLCIFKGNDVFKSAIAVAPVTNWKWYDSVYTERYMRTFDENVSGYQENSPVYFADKLKGNYLLVHGMGDDNVHFQHTAEMANALIKNNKQFDTYFYPNKNHGIFGGFTRLHLFTKMTDFLINKL